MSGKTIRLICLAAGASLFVAATNANAGVIYQDNFARTGDLAGSTPRRSTAPRPLGPPTPAVGLSAAEPPPPAPSRGAAPSIPATHSSLQP